jgi:hypothetical protein
MGHPNTPIVLVGLISVTKAYTGKSKFDFWKDLQVGDTLLISMYLKCEHKRGGIYVPTVRINNRRANVHFICSLGEAVNYLDKIEYATNDDT